MSAVYIECDAGCAKYRSPLLDTAPGAVQEESNGRVQQDVTVEVFMGFVQHAAIVTGVNVVPPTILGGINVKLWHAHQAHLLIVGVALNPTHPVTSWEATKPHDAGAQPKVHRPCRETSLSPQRVRRPVDMWSSPEGQKITKGHLLEKNLSFKNPRVTCPQCPDLWMDMDGGATSWSISIICIYIWCK